MFSLDSKISEFPLVVVDLETSGAYPIGDDICELAAIRYENGKIVDDYQSLVKPRRPMSDKIIKIHGISNEMVENSPTIDEVIGNMHEKIKDAIFVAHHAPFDLGFTAYDFEKAGLELPSMPALCSSLLSRALFPESKNHRLQTLVHFFGLEKGTAHRALDDAKACLEVTKHCIEKLGDPSLKMLLAAQTKKLNWKDFSIEQIRRRPEHQYLVNAIEKELDVFFDYKKGNGIDAGRPMRPLGIVRNPDGDYVQGHCLRDNKTKRFYLNKITSVYEAKT